MTLKKHMESNHPNDTIFHEETTENLNIFPQIKISSTTLNVKSSVDPTITSHFANPLIVNVPTDQLVQTESSLQIPNSVIQNRDCDSMYKKEAIFTMVDYKNNQIGHNITDTINPNDQCEYNITDTYKLMIHRKTHLTDQHTFL